MDKKDCKKIMQYLGVIIETQENNTYQELLSDLLDIALENDYTREKNTGIVYKKVREYAYTRYLEPMDFLNKVFIHEPLFISNVNNMDNMIKFMKMYDNISFPFLNVNKKCIGFSNGVFNTETCQFTDGISDQENGNCVMKYIDIYFDQGNFETPLMDSVLNYQFNKHILEDIYDSEEDACETSPEQDVSEFIYSFLGRMFGIRDNFQCMLYLLGESGTGKSVILEVLKACFNNIGSIGDTFEEKFGLGYLYDKDIIVADDLPKNIGKVFPQQMFQTCVSCSNVSVSIKNGGALEVVWSVPMIFASNYQIAYSDMGQISRRVLVANFEKTVNNPDTFLSKKIIDTELPAFINKCCVYYKKLLEKAHSKTIWQLCPRYFHIQRRELKMERNPFFKFLFENTRVVEGHFETMEKIKNQFNDWSSGTKVHKLDSGTFNQVNKQYIVKNSKICKSCNKLSMKGCCDEYKHSNRTARLIVLNIELNNDY